MLSRLRISQRLSLLLAVPIGATVVIGVPAVVDRIDESRAAATVLAGITDVQLVAGLIQELQEERQLSLAYLASTSVHRSVLVGQHSSTVEKYVRARAAVAGPTAEDLRAQLALLGGLADQRGAVLARRTSAGAVWRAYSDRIAGLIDALRLADQPDADAIGLRHTSALDALLRAQEQSSRASAALLLAYTDPDEASAYAEQAQLLSVAFLDRFTTMAEPSLVALRDQATAGVPSQRIGQLVTDLAAQRPVSATLEEVLSLAQHEANLHRLVQEHVGRTIADGASARAAGARTGAIVMTAVTAGILLAIVLLGHVVNRSVSRPLRRITVAATTIADLAGREMIRTSLADETDDRPPQLAALTLRSDDEIGELASAFNRVQATAALLMEQQVTTRRNVATMFGNIAHRTQSLVSRQLVAIDELERDERDEQRLAKLYRLDHLTARLRRSADSLLVIAGARDDTRMTLPQPLSDVVRSAMAEVEGYQSVALGRIDRLVLKAAVVADLTLLLAELLENATSFSPPGALVEVSAVRTSSGDCVIRVVDHGMGMTPQRLEQENQRLVAAERLDVAPTAALGLFVVGRIARRHGIGVRLSATPVCGVTAEVTIPPTLALPDKADETEPLIATPSRPIPGLSVHDQPAAERSFPDQSAWDRGVRDRTGPPSWFEPAAPGPAAPSPNGRPAQPSPQFRGGLRRREPGRSLPETRRPGAPEPTRAGTADPDAERAAMAAFVDGASRAETHGGETGRHGLRRRQPGAHLAPDIRQAPGRHRRSDDHPPLTVDPEAEREQMSAYLDAIAASHSAPPMGALAGSEHLSTPPWPWHCWSGHRPMYLLVLLVGMSRGSGPPWTSSVCRRVAGETCGDCRGSRAPGR